MISVRTILRAIPMLPGLIACAVLLKDGCAPTASVQTAQVVSVADAGAPRRMGVAPPFAQARVSLNGGASAVGGITAAGGDVVQLSATSTVAWRTQKWEIYEYPAGFALPSGWSADANGSYYSYAVTPAPFTLPAISSLWGKWMLRLRH